MKLEICNYVKYSVRFINGLWLLDSMNYPKETVIEKDDLNKIWLLVR